MNRSDFDGTHATAECARHFGDRAAGSNCIGQLPVLVRQPFLAVSLRHDVAGG
jgi:hypothetical protein